MEFCIDFEPDACGLVITISTLWGQAFAFLSLCGGGTGGGDSAFEEASCLRPRRNGNRTTAFWLIVVCGKGGLGPTMQRVHGVGPSVAAAVLSHRRPSTAARVGPRRSAARQRAAVDDTLIAAPPEGEESPPWDDEQHLNLAPARGAEQQQPAPVRVGLPPLPPAAAAAAGRLSFRPGRSCLLTHQPAPRSSHRWRT